MAMGGLKMVVKRKPHFFKILLGDFSHQLRIPPAFTKHISKEAFDEARLKGPGGGQWRVNISQGSCNDTYFDSGWKAFVKDHHLHEHDILVFRYNGERHFSVRIFDKTACEREDAFSTKNSQESAYQARRKTHASEEFKPHTKKQKSKKRNREQFESGQCKPESQKLELKNEEDFYQPTTRVKGKVCGTLGSFSSKLPFFKKCLSKSHLMRPRNFYIPKDFLRYLPKTKSKFTLEDPNGKKWEVFIYHGDRPTFSRGIIAFCKGNNLKEGDTCIFELFGILRFRVHIFPLEKEVGQKTSSGNRHVTNKTKKDFGCHFEKSEKHGRVQYESGKYEPSALKDEMKNKQDFYQQGSRIKGKGGVDPGKFSSKFPFFRKCLSKTHVRRPIKMYIPQSFLVYLPKNKSKFTFEDPNGKNWEVCINYGGHNYFSGGMSAFCRGNNLKEGDTCIFELFDVSTFRVYVYPVERDMKQKISSGERQVTHNVKKVFDCHFCKSKKRNRVQFESEKYEHSSLKIEMKNKEFCQFTPRVEGKFCQIPDSFSSKSPFFRKCLPKFPATGKQYKMHIPASFHHYLPKIKSKVILQDSNGKNWDMLISRDGPCLSNRRLSLQELNRVPTNLKDVAKVSTNHSCFYNWLDYEQEWLHCTTFFVRFGAMYPIHFADWADSLVWLHCIFVRFASENLHDYPTSYYTLKISDAGA